MNNKQGFIPLAILITILVIVVSGGTYYFVKQKEVKLLPSTENKTEKQTIELQNNPSTIKTDITEDLDKKITALWGECKPQDSRPNQNNIMLDVRPTTDSAVFAVIKFREGTDVRVRSGKLVSLCGANLSSINDTLFKFGFTPIQKYTPAQEEELRLLYQNARINDSQAQDLNLYVTVSKKGNTNYDLLADFLKQLSFSELIEHVQAQLLPVPPPTMF